MIKQWCEAPRKFLKKLKTFASFREDGISIDADDSIVINKDNNAPWVAIILFKHSCSSVLI